MAVPAEVFSCVCKQNTFLISGHGLQKKLGAAAGLSTLFISVVCACVCVRVCDCA